MKPKYIYILFTALVFLFVITNCRSKNKTENDICILKIGDFNISSDEFDNAVSEMNESSTSLTKDEIELITFDNFIGLGLLAEFAKQKKYEQNPEFKAIYEENLRQLRIKYDKFLRARKHTEAIGNCNETIEYQDIGITIDYVRVPKKQKLLAKKMFDFFTSGASFSDMKANPEYGKWVNLGVSFNESIALSSVIFTKKVFDQIAPFNDGAVKLIKERSSYYIVRTNRTGELLYNIKNKKVYFLNAIMAERVEQGETIFDPFLLESKIKFNQKLLSAIDFTFPAMRRDANFNHEVIADLNGVKIYVSDIKRMVSKLSVEFQNLFINKSTRKQAIASLILKSYSSTRLNTDMDFNLEKNLRQAILLQHSIDTIGFIKKWIINNYDKISTTSFNNRINETIALPNKQNNLSLDAIDDWLNPKAYLYNNSLSLNYEMIDSLNFSYDNSDIKNFIVAGASNWSLIVKDLIKELDKLTPETRIEIAKKNQSADLIKYLAIRDTKIQTLNIKMNSDILKKITIAGNSFDNSITVINENDTVGSLGKTVVLVKDLRPIIELLPQEIKKKKLTKMEDKLKVFNQIIMDQFWADLFDEKELNSNDEYKKEKEYYYNMLLAQLYYNNEIKLPFFEQINDNDLKLKYNTAVGIINNDKLNSLLAEGSLVYSIKVNSEFLKKKYKFNLSASQFLKNITHQL
jgi:hypothetical protein